MRLRLILLGLLFLLPVSSCGQTVPFQPGERFAYQVKWNFLKTGQLILTTRDDVYVEGEGAFHLQAEVEASGVLHRFTSFRARIDSYPSWKDFRPLLYQYASWEPDTSRLEVTRFPRGENQSYRRTEKYKNSEQTIKEEVFPVSDFFQDPLSLLYYLRIQKLEVGDFMRVPMGIDEKNYSVTVKVLRRTTIKVLGKRWPAVIVEPGALLNGSPFWKGSVWVWLSDDEKKIPLHISARVPFGLVTATLTTLETKP